MDVPEETYTFIYYGYDSNFDPSLTLYAEGADSFVNFKPRGKTATLQFDTSTRYCTGWHNLATSESWPCPDSAGVAAEYNQCMHCQRKTGFNPAFYNASSVSEQQQARNAQPHFLYLAHFGSGVVKVGISWSKRSIRRLLDQGARSCLIIKEYPNANVARQYEAKIAGLQGIAETLQRKTKYKLLTLPYDTEAAIQELLTTRQRLHTELNIQAENNHPQILTQYYIGDNTFAPHKLVHLHDGIISGTNIGLIGSAYIAEQNGIPYFLSLGSLAGYKVTIRSQEQPNMHAPQQTSLF